MIRRALCVAILAASTALASAQSPTTVAFTNARIIDGTGRAPIERGTLVVTNGRVTAVGPSASVTVPAGAQRIDATGKTIVPGFVNAHGHVEAQMGAALPVRDDLIRRLRIYALYGVTTVVSLGSSAHDEAAGIRLMQEQERAGLDRSRVYTSGTPVEGETAAQARAEVARLADLEVYAIKFRLNGGANDMNEAAWSAIIDEAPVGRLYRDGRLIIPGGEGPVRDRRKLSVVGIIMVALVLSKRGEVIADPQVELDGVPTETADGAYMEDVVLKAVEGTLKSIPAAKRRDVDLVEDAVRRSVRSAVDLHWGKKPIVKVMASVVEGK